MKLDRKFDRLAAGLFGFFAAFGGIGCIVTGIGFPGISMGAVAVTCAIAAAAAALSAGRKWFGLLPGGLLLLGWLLWKNGNLNTSMEALLSRITTMYDAGYGWGVIRWSPTALEPALAQMAFRFLGSFLAFGICWSFLQCKGVWLPALLTCLPVIPCMLLTDTVPDAKYLYLPLLCLVLLLLMRIAKKRGQGASLLKLLALPVAISVFLLFLWMPQGSSGTVAFADAIIAYVQELFDNSSSGQAQPEAPVRPESNWVNLSTVGPKSSRRGKVMEVTAQKTEYLYLRGTVYNAYWGTWWDSWDSSVKQPEHFQTDNLTVTVTTTALHDVLYLPYLAYGINGSSLLLAEVNGVVENPAFWRSYTVQYQQLPSYEESWETPAVGVSDQYLQLPNSTKAAALAYLQRELPELDALTGVWSRANAIVRHVSASASYSLRTPRMPDDKTDFAMWFLEESDTGYCTHFATAAVVLLRAAGIPCRYVTGYLVDARADTAVAVINDNAHAWVECYLSGVGWVPLEPTPSGGISQTVGADTTTPSETEGTSETTEPTTTVPSTSLEETEEPAETTKNTTPAPPPSTTPSTGIGTIGGADGPQVPPRTFPQWLKWVLGCLCLVVLTVTQWPLRRQLRLRRRSRGNRSAQALARWREITLHARVRMCDPDQRMLELAQRAKFSHHAITREELKEMDLWLTDSTNAIRTMGLWRRLLATLILALY